MRGFDKLPDRPWRAVPDHRAFFRNEVPARSDLPNNDENHLLADHEGLQKPSCKVYTMPFGRHALLLHSDEYGHNAVKKRVLKDI